MDIKETYIDAGFESAEKVEEKNLRIRNFSWSYKIYISNSLVDNLVFHAFS
jgi:hypothetical protein